MARWIGVAALAASILAFAGCGLLFGGGGRVPATSVTRESMVLGPPRKPNLELVALGRALFFDPRLSGDGSTACASCHQPERAFSDGRPMAESPRGVAHFRNAPTLLAVDRARYVFRDGRSSGEDLEGAVRQHLLAPWIMNADARLVIARLEQVPEYAALYRQSLWGAPSFERTLEAIAAYLESLRGAPTIFDTGTFDEQQLRGWGIFAGRGGCVRCHSGPAFSDRLPHRIGAPDHPELATSANRQRTLRAFLADRGFAGYEHARSDPGHFAVSGDPADRGVFVTPTLRGLRHTAPYMHDGALATLADVVDFYSERVSGDAAPLRLTPLEKADLLAFLSTLSGGSAAVKAPESPPYAPIERWREQEN